LGNNAKKAHLRAIRRILIDIKGSLDDLDYWIKENEIGVVELVVKDIQKDYRIIKMHLEYLSDKF